MSSPGPLQKQLEKARFYGIVDLTYVPAHKVISMTEKLILGGVDIIQLRAKNATTKEIRSIAIEMTKVIPKGEALFIINDDPSLVDEAEADGVHIGQEDGSVAAARAQMEEGRIVGKSTHSLTQALAAAEEKPDYIAIGPLFATPTKPDYIPVGLELIRQVRERVELPQFCIGGINEKTLPSVLEAGAERVVLVSALLKSENPTAYARAISSSLREVADAIGKG